MAFCAHAILSEVPLIVRDALEDPRFFDNPLVTGPPFIRFYAGVPLRTAEGFNLGTLCVIDVAPRDLAEAELTLLVDLADVVVDELALRRMSQKLGDQAVELARALGEADRSRHLFERMAYGSPDLIYVLDLATRRAVYTNRDVGAYLGYGPEDVRTMGPALLATVLHPDDLPQVVGHFRDLEGLADDGLLELTCRVRQASGDYRWFLARENVFSRDDAGKPQEILGVASDVTAQKMIEEQLALLATTDAMTGARNHRAFRDRLAQLVAEGRRGRRFALVMADIDHFKRLNDTHGHLTGDRALTAFAKALMANVREVDHVARYGGEEFSVLVVDVDLQGAVHQAERLRSAILAITDPLRMTASFGVCPYVAGMDAEALVKRADEALYRAKREGRDRVAAG